MALFDKRKNYKPFLYGKITTPLIDAMWAGHWTHNKFSFSSDIQDFKTLITEEERGVISRAVLLISNIEVSVKSYWSSIGKLIPQPEIGDMGAVFGGIEVIHSRAYSEILTKLGLDDKFQGLLSEGVVQNRVNYLNKYNDKVYKDDKKQIAYSLALFTIFTEYVSLFSQFYIILGFNRFNNILKDTANIVNYTNKEETLHAEGGFALLKQIKTEYPEVFDDEFKQRIKEEAKEALDAEVKLISWMLQGYSNDFLSQDILENFLKNRMNIALKRIGVTKTFDVNKKYLEKTYWMDEEVYGQNMADFFWKDPTEYTKANRSYSPKDLYKNA